MTDSRLIYTWRRLLQFMLLAAGYVAGGAHRHGLGLHARARRCSSRLPAGVAVAGLLLFGLGFWPAVALGSFIATLTNRQAHCAWLPV